jgi:hypothetical protein
MQRYRAILVDTRTNQPLSPDWHPTIWPTELESANASLASRDMTYRWRWLDRVTTLHGSVTLQAAAHDADS